jgi:hypothetical protein
VVGVQIARAVMVLPRRVSVRLERASGEEREGLFAVVSVFEAQGQVLPPPWLRQQSCTGERK